MRPNRRVRHAFPLRLESLDSRVLPSTGLPFDSFDSSGNPLLGERRRVDQPLLQLFANWQNTQRLPGTPLSLPQPDMLVTGNRVQVMITGSDITALRPALKSIGYQDLGT